MNLHTTLKAYNEVSPITKEQQLILNEAQTILNNSAEKDLSILDKLGMNDNLKEYQKITSENEQAAQFDEIYDISVIRKMAIHYGLRFLPSDMYKGTIDPVLPSVMNKFCEKNNITIDPVKSESSDDWRSIGVRHLGGRSRSSHQKQFFILAPSASFRLEERPKDPIIFYKINANKYAFIHKWGNDLSWDRKLKNYVVRSTMHFVLFYTFLVAALAGSFVHITGSPEFYTFLILWVINIPIMIEGSFNDDKWDSQYL